MPQRTVLNPLFGIVLGAIFVALVAVQFVGIHYPLVIQDEPLRNPARIVNVSGKLVTLEDGRKLRMEGIESEDDWNSIFQQSNYQIEIEANDDGAMIIARQKGWICGTPWAQPIRVPLIPDIVYKNRKKVVGFANLEP